MFVKIVYRGAHSFPVIGRSEHTIECQRIQFKSFAGNYKEALSSVETIFAYENKVLDDPAETKYPAEIWMVDVDQDNNEFIAGHALLRRADVYLMNEKGQTIDSYHIEE